MARHMKRLLDALTDRLHMLVSRATITTSMQHARFCLLASDCLKADELERLVMVTDGAAHLQSAWEADELTRAPTAIACRPCCSYR